MIHKLSIKKRNADSAAFYLELRSIAMLSQEGEKVLEKNIQNFRPETLKQVQTLVDLLQKVKSKVIEFGNLIAYEQEYEDIFLKNMEKME